VRSIVRLCLWALSVGVGMACNRENPANNPASAKPKPKASVPIEPAVDNSRCHVCHLNYTEEILAAKHALVGVGCEKCHGASDAHCGDENNITAPDTMYPTEKINPFCMQCHPELSDIHKPILAGTFERKYCTECHGDHRLTRRSRVWDKTTGRLLMSDQVAAPPPKDAKGGPGASGNPAID